MYADISTGCSGLQPTIFTFSLPNGDIHRDILWYYRTLQPECGQMTGYLAFYDEKG